MRHTVEIADTDGNTMQLSISVDTFPSFGGSWRSLTKGMIRYHNGPIEQHGAIATGMDVTLFHGGKWGIELNNFTSWGTVNDEGSGTLVQPWVLGLTPGAIDWSIV